MSQVVGLPNNSYKPITNTVWVRARLCKLLDSQPQVIKFTSCFPMVGGSLQVLRLRQPLKLVVMILLKVALNTKNKIIKFYILNSSFLILISCKKYTISALRIYNIEGKIKNSYLVLKFGIKNEEININEEREIIKGGQGYGVTPLSTIFQLYHGGQFY